MLVSRVPVRSVAVASRRALATATYDWEALKRKVTSPEAKAEAEKQHAAFTARLTAAARVGAPAPINWEAYQEKLPHYNLAAIKANFESFMAAIPDIEYDPREDEAEHKKKEAEAAQLQGVARARLAELKALEAEAKDFELHEYTSAHELYLRYPGLYEKMQTRVLDRHYFEDLDAPVKQVELTHEEAERQEAELWAKGRK